MRRAMIAVLGLGGVLACNEASPERAATVPFETCRLTGVPRPALCGTVTVPENRAQNDGKTLDLKVVVIPAQQPVAPDPVFFLAGGPGQAATEVYPLLWPTLRELGRERDLVLIDQRGTGGSAPLACDEPEDPTLAQVLDPDADLERLERCAAALEHDPKNFITTVAVEDFDDVREALGYDAINLVGASYGTRAALVYARQYPNRVRSLVLDGVAPVGMALPLSFARDGQRAFDLLVQACHRQPACKAAFPDPAGDLKQVLERYGEQGREVSLEDPRTGAEVEVKLSAASIASGVRGLLYSPQISALLPWSLRRAAQGDLQPLVTQLVVLSGGMEATMSEGLMLSVLCAEDISTITDAELAAQSANTFLGETIARQFREMCERWPHADVSPAYREAVRSDAPALLLSGELDPATPPRWAEAAMPGLTRARHVEVPGAGHGTLILPCVRELVVAFIEQPDPTALEPTCMDAPVQFFIDFAGPPA